MANFNRLPTDIVLDIITRLPTESILDCKLVCKPWRKLVSHHPSFSKLHLIHLNRSTDSGKLGFVLKAHAKQLHYFEYNEKHHGKPMHSIRSFCFTPPFNYWLGGSFNGLVCLFGYGNPTACICNLVTREYVMLPNFDKDRNDDCPSGFGYLPLTNEYKVVMLYKSNREPNFIQVKVYTLGSGKGWRNVGRLDSKFVGFSDDHGVFVNGALHWAEWKGKRVLAFDLIEEKFRELPLPPDSKLENFALGELDGVLFYLEIVKSNCYDIWLLKGNKKEQVKHRPLGWKKEFSLPKMEPFSFTKSGGLLCFSSKSLHSYDARTSKSKKLVKYENLDQIFPHQITLVSLKELGEENTKFF